MTDQDITRAEFKKYEKCRKSGKTNMFHITRVQQLTHLDTEKIYTIMKHYGALKAKYDPLS